jgi:hypothetical protein
VPESVSPNADMRALAGGNWVCYVHVNCRVEPRVGGGQSLSRVCASELRVLSCVASMDSPIGENGNWEIDWAAPIKEKGAGMNGCSWGDRWGIETGNRRPKAGKYLTQTSSSSILLLDSAAKIDRNSRWVISRRRLLLKEASRRCRERRLTSTER